MRPFRRISGFFLRGLRPLAVALFSLLLVLSGCDAVEQPKATPYYAEPAPPKVAEFRWSNGKLPKSFDPALAASAPETDIVRAIYEGLTEVDPRSMELRPGVAEKWSSDETFTNWTFQLRANAKWTDGSPVTARDFERSWQRLAVMGDAAAHPELLSNFKREPVRSKETVRDKPTSEETKNDEVAGPSATPQPSPETGTVAGPQVASSPQPTATPKVVLKLAVKAVDERTLTVSLEVPDADFPKLVAHAMFRPVFEGTASFAPADAAGLVTNGAFRPVAGGAGGLVAERSAAYWNAAKTALERVRFVPADTAEAALDAYRRGELDAVTNFEFSAAVLKLLEPYSDFQRNTHGALNFYEFNYRKYPFDDRRVREALATAIERERLTETELGGATRPAFQFLPFKEDTAEAIVQDTEYAAELLSDAGFPGGENFPTIRLIVNRNDVQQRIARSIARMWKQNLNIQTEVVVKEPNEIDEVRKAGDYDLIRRGVVLPTADELASLNAIIDLRSAVPVGLQAAEAPSPDARRPKVEPTAERKPETPSTRQDDELFRLYAIPLYFPTSYALVKPYVSGFEMGGLDAPVLSDVRVDNQWQPKKP